MVMTFFLSNEENNYTQRKKPQISMLLFFVIIKNQIS